MFGAWLAAGFVYCFLACNWTSLRLSVKIIKVTSDWVADTKRLLFAPLGFFIFGTGLFMLWVAGLICVMSIPATDDPITSKGPGDQAKNIDWSETTRVMIYIMWFGGIWTVFFLTSLNEYITIVAAISWYYSDKKKEDSDGIPGDSEVFLGFKWAFCY